MTLHLETNDLINPQQLEVAVNGPDGATHLILCTGLVELCPLNHETYTFLVGPQIAQRQFVGAIASGALSTIQGSEKSSAKDCVNVELRADLISIDANYDGETKQVKVKAEVSSNTAMIRLVISYKVSILAELPGF